MSNSQTKKVPFWYWIFSALAFIWNAMGVDQYIGRAYETERWKSALMPEQIELSKSLPSWVVAAFAIAVFAGLLGSLGLLLKKHWCKPLFLISFVAVILQTAYTLSQGYYNNMPMTLSILVFSAILVWFSNYAGKKTWFNN